MSGWDDVACVGWADAVEDRLAEIRDALDRIAETSGRADFMVWRGKGGVVGLTAAIGASRVLAGLDVWHAADVSTAGDDVGIARELRDGSFLVSWGGDGGDEVMRLKGDGSATLVPAVARPQFYPCDREL